MDQFGLTEAFESFSKQKILVIGDAMIDSYLWGDVERISPEAPVPVITKTKRDSRLGGAANVALNIKSLGAEPILCSVIGKGDRADTFRTLLETNHLERAGIIESDKRVTTVKTRIISHNQHLLRIDEEMSDPVDAETEEKFLAHLQDIMNRENPNAVVFEGYDKGCITPKIIDAIAARSKKHGIPVLVDPKKRNFLQYRQVTLFKPNFKELVEGLNLSNIGKSDVESIFRATKRFHKKQDIEWIMVTLSEAGIFLSNNREYKIIPAKVRDISDVSGAGDTIIGIAATGMAAGLSPWRIAELSNIGGGQVCEKPGIVPVNKSQLLEEAREFIRKTQDHL